MTPTTLSYCYKSERDLYIHYVLQVIANSHSLSGENLESLTNTRRVNTDSTSTLLTGCRCLVVNSSCIIYLNAID